MMPKPMTMTSSYRSMASGTRDLHQLLAAGQDDSAEADAIRDATDDPWEALSDVERNRIRNLSEDLFSLFEPPAPPQPMNPQAQAKLNEAYEAKQQGEWDRALDLLRRWRAQIDPALLSYLRGSIWLSAGDPATAVLFFDHAFQLVPDNESYQFHYLHALDIADSAAGLQRAARILAAPDNFSPAVITIAAKIELRSALEGSDAQARAVAQRLEPILKNAIAKFEAQEPSTRKTSIYVAAISLLGAAQENLGASQSAWENYSKGLQFEPDNIGLLVARGMLHYGASPQAVIDLETAIQYGAPLIWPYVLLAHHCLETRRFEDSRRLCERALDLAGSPAVMSELCEWIAIAQAELGYPREMVRAAFERAIRFDPANQRAKRNLAAFEDSSNPIAAKEWEKRSPGAVRKSGQAEMRFALAA